LPSAAAALREAIRLQPEFAGAHLTLSSVLQQLGDTQAAAAERRIGDEISKKNNNRQAAMFATNFGKKLLQSGDLEGAIEQLSAAIHADSEFADAHFQMGLALQQKGDAVGARQEFYKAEQIEAAQAKRPIKSIN
jgi:Tfp pilus assembly protein PilF